MKEPNKVTDEPFEEEIIEQQPISLKSWGQKFLVALLCIASFYGGWKSYESNMANECYASGGQIIEGKRTFICELP
ncbi:hypothetical protein [uncultured Psychrobacter sp.]|uniref:hypothetical protein n=1 Tax=uncultured Psychrobacter sp. TaxID=259303 RepID=UPI00260770EF|nr:hypothetical protein [uncultured Psychrobacter sp.]